MTKENNKLPSPDEFFNGIRKYCELEPDKAICLALSNGEKYWVNSFAEDGHYISPNGDLLADYHDFCDTNALDQNDKNNAEHFLKQLKLKQKMSKINEDFE